MNHRRFEQSIAEIYGNDTEIIREQLERYQTLLGAYVDHFGAYEQIRLFSCPGRVELLGNHTDHQNGVVIAAAIQQDAIAAACDSELHVIDLYSIDLDQHISVDLDRLEPIEEERETSRALVRGIVSEFRKAGHSIGGFRATVSSRVPIGMGMSSSAAFEMLVATILNRLYNNGAIDIVELSKASQNAENRFFGKPCGMMDQIACAYGGAVKIDFLHGAEVTSLSLDFNRTDYELAIVDTGGGHEDLTDAYAAAPSEMRDVARYFGARALRELRADTIMANMARLRAAVGDRAVLRALHFFEEMDRVEQFYGMLRSGDLGDILTIISQAGYSSLNMMQNCVAPGASRDQGLLLAFMLTERIVAPHNGRREGAARIHGGGFAGNLQAVIERPAFERYRNKIEAVFGAGSARTVSIRSAGAVELDTVG